MITRLLEEQEKAAPVLIGGLALSYYTREVYFTSDMAELPENDLLSELMTFKKKRSS
ncbi:MAG: hypothetical protein MUP98_15490 [Candidatus Aminicenantes bacterium]|nr:hypothetical protein [Candidatus Aminicenantes bacterium]